MIGKYDSKRTDESPERSVSSPTLRDYFKQRQDGLIYQLDWLQKRVASLSAEDLDQTVEAYELKTSLYPPHPF